MAVSASVLKETADKCAPASELGAVVIRCETRVQSFAASDHCVRLADEASPASSVRPVDFVSSAVEHRPEEWTRLRGGVAGVGAEGDSGLSRPGVPFAEFEQLAELEYLAGFGQCAQLGQLAGFGRCEKPRVVHGESHQARCGQH